MNKRIIFEDRVIEKNISDNNELDILCKQLGDYIGTAALRKTALRNINEEFSYFSPQDRSLILEHTLTGFDVSRVIDNIRSELYKWLSENDSINIEGFVNFRLKEYSQYVAQLVEDGALRIIAGLECRQIIEHFKDMLERQVPYIDTVYVYSKDGTYDIQNESHTRLMTVNSCDELFLNVMLSLAPQNIYFYGTCSGVFFNTLRSVFENRLIICES